MSAGAPSTPHDPAARLGGEIGVSGRCRADRAGIDRLTDLRGDRPHPRRSVSRGGRAVRRHRGAWLPERLGPVDPGARGPAAARADADGGGRRRRPAARPGAGAVWRPGSAGGSRWLPATCRCPARSGWPGMRGGSRSRAERSRRSWPMGSTAAIWRPRMPPPDILRGPRVPMVAAPALHRVFAGPRDRPVRGRHRRGRPGAERPRGAAGAAHAAGPAEADHRDAGRPRDREGRGRADRGGGPGAGGHAGMRSLFGPIRGIRERFDGPLPRSGAIATGASVLAARVMGAGHERGPRRCRPGLRRDAGGGRRGRPRADDHGRGARPASRPRRPSPGVFGRAPRALIPRAGTDPHALPAPEAATDLGSGSSGPETWTEIGGAAQGIDAVRSVRSAAEPADVPSRRTRTAA